MADPKLMALSVLGLLGSLLADLFGGWEAGLQSLLIFMVIDYITGLVLAGVFKKSRKSRRGALESRAAWKGLVRKGATLGVVLIACRLDLMMGTAIIRDATVIACCGNELLSITENLGLMGVPLPGPVVRGISVLLEKNEDNENPD